jgi:hypothetical protein
MLLTFAVRELTAELARFRRFSEQAETVATPSIRYLDTIRPPGVPERLSWHDRVRKKRVSIPVASAGGILAAIAIEIGRAIVEGRLHW